MSDTNRLATRKDLLIYTCFVFTIGFFTGLLIAYKLGTWMSIASLAVLSFVTLGGFIVIDETIKSVSKPKEKLK